MRPFKDRSHAGQLLAEQLLSYKNKLNTIILALPRGGVPVAFEIAKKLSLPLGVYLVRKLGVPGEEEVALGAIANGEVTVFNPDILNSLSLTPNQINTVLARERRELARRKKVYRHNAPFSSVMDKTIILVDDGVATGTTVQAAITALKHSNPARIILAVPVAASSVYSHLKKEVDQVVCLLTPEPLYGVSMWYQDFSQTSDSEVIKLLKLSKNFSSKKEK